MSANIIEIGQKNIIESSKVYTIKSNNEVNNIEYDKNNIIESDADVREVIPKGYLLSQINLSTVPDVIADAITKAMSDTKDAVLSDALIETLRTSLENLNDGVYKKTYIDNTITYLEDLLTSKVNLETVASIAENKIATAVEGFAATSQVNLLTSRVEDSESEIIRTQDTINTKDLARAAQITDMEARIDDTFAGYSEAIDLYVDGDGTVRAGKIEELKIKVQGDYETLLDSITSLQNQNDGVVETISGTHIIVDANKNLLATAEPYATWLATDTTNGNTLKRFNHTGDTYILTTVGSDGSSEYSGAYRFVKIEPKLTSPNKTDADGFTWSRITDTGVEEAFAKANQAIDLANGKVSTYYGTNANKNNMSNAWTAQQKIDNIGDIYYVSDNKNKPYRWSGTAWVIVDDTKISDLTVSLASTDSVVSTVSSWAANASKLITDTAGNITGWAFGNGTNTKSFFTIMADVFKIKTTTTSKSPFSISGDDIIFNGKVSFTNTTGVPNFALASSVKSENTTENGITYIPNPVGATYSGAVSTTGALVVELPNTWTNTMMTLEIEVCDYALNRSFSLKVAGYNYIPRPAWYSTSSNLIGSSSLGINVRFGHNGTKCCIVIGETTSSWSYPKVKVKNCTFSHYNYEITQWDDGWRVYPTTSFTGFSFTLTHSNSWQSEVQNAINNNLTTIDGGKIVTNEAFVNNLNAVGGIVADNISATEINGITINGGTFNGARINGSVIKASYLDLDGELEVLTNFRISVATRNANPSLYTDAVYISADNEYRIPSLSQIRSATGGGGVLSGRIRPYNNANSGHNNKCVRIRPEFNINASYKVFTSNGFFTAFNQVLYFYRLYLCGVEQAVIYSTNPRSDDAVYLHIKDSITGSVTTWGRNFNHTPTSDYVIEKTLSCGLNLKINLHYFFAETGNAEGDRDYVRINFTLHFESSTVTLANNYTSGELLTCSVAYGAAHYPVNLVTINNMI